MEYYYGSITKSSVVSPNYLAGKHGKFEYIRLMLALNVKRYGDLQQS